MTKNFLLAGFVALSVFAAQAVEVKEQEGLRWFEEMVALPDGVKLYTYGTAPAKGVKCPIIVVRGPYVPQSRMDMLKFAREKKATLDRGYAWVMQHCRGSGMSEGFFIPHETERADSLALLDYVRKLPWYNGEIYIEGGSYGASLHWAYLDTNPSDIKGAYLPFQDLKRYNICYRNGFFKTGLAGGWYCAMYGQTDKKLKRDGSVGFHQFPLADFSKRYWGRPAPGFDNLLTHPNKDDPFWTSDEIGSGNETLQGLAKSTMPIFLRTAFYDIYTEGVFDMWREMTPERRANCALLVGAYDHGGGVSKEFVGTKGEFPGGDGRPDIGMLEWFDAIRAAAREKRPFRGLKNAPAGTVSYYPLWENTWVTEEFFWDGPRSVAFTLGEKDRAYTYDPKRPLPNFPGSGGLCFGGMQAQPKPDFRDDVVSFILPPITERLDVRGRMTADITVETDCADTCFYIRVSVNKGDGKWYLLRDDITSLSQEARTDRLSIRNKQYTIAFRFPDHAFRLEPGDRLRVDISSACSQYAPHTNVAGDQFKIREPKIAHNKIIASKSRLVLSVK